MVLGLTSLMYSYEADAIRGHTGLDQRKVFGRCIGLAVAIGVDRLNGAQPRTWRDWCDCKVDGAVDVADHCEALLSFAVLDDCPQLSRWSALKRIAVKTRAKKRIIDSEFIEHFAPVADQRAERLVDSFITWIGQPVARGEDDGRQKPERR